MQEHADRFAAREHVRYELAGQGLSGEERHENPGGFGRFRVSGNAHCTTFAHFLDDTEDAFLGGSGDLVAQLHSLLLQQLVHRLQFWRTVENDRFALAAIEVVEHFPVAQVAGDADHAFAGGKGIFQCRRTGSRR